MPMLKIILQCSKVVLNQVYDFTKFLSRNNNATKPHGHHQVTKQDKIEVVLYSMNSRNKDKLVAKGTLVSKEKTYVIGGNMLGVQYVAVFIRGCTYLGDEKLVRPYEKLQTVRDAMGSAIAWPRSHVGVFSFKHCVCSNLHMCDMLFIRNLSF